MSVKTELLSRNYDKENTLIGLYIDYDRNSTYEAISLLNEAGFQISVLGVSGVTEPEIEINPPSIHVFRGLDPIKQLISNQTTS